MKGVNFIFGYDYQEPTCNKYPHIYVHVNWYFDFSLGHIPRCGIAGSNLILKGIYRCFSKRWWTLTFFFHFSEQKLLVVARLIHIKSYHIILNFHFSGWKPEKVIICTRLFEFHFPCILYLQNKICVFLTNFWLMLFIVTKSL